MPTHNDRPTIRQLEYLVAVAEERSFSRAAERCFVSQPTLSAQIRLLESRIGHVCFERTSKGAVTTPIGEELVERARATIRAVDDLLGVGEEDHRPLVGSLRLGVVSTVTPYLIPDVLSELARHYPELDVVLHDDLGERLKARLASGELDAIVAPLPTNLDGCVEFEFAEDPFVVVAPAGSKLGDLAEPIAAEALTDAELILLDDPHCLRGHALEVCRRAAVSPNVSLHATSIGTLVQLVRAGLGSTLLPSLVLDLEIRWLRELKVKRFAEPQPGRRLALVWREGSPRDDDFRLLGEILEGRARAKIRAFPVATDE